MNEHRIIIQILAIDCFPIAWHKLLCSNDAVSLLGACGLPMLADIGGSTHHGRRRGDDLKILPHLPGNGTQCFFHHR